MADSVLSCLVLPPFSVQPNQALAKWLFIGFCSKSNDDGECSGRQHCWIEWSTTSFYDCTTPHLPAPPLAVWSATSYWTVPWIHIYLHFIARDLTCRQNAIIFANWSRIVFGNVARSCACGERRKWIQFSHTLCPTLSPTRIINGRTWPNQHLVSSISRSLLFCRTHRELNTPFLLPPLPDQPAIDIQWFVYKLNTYWRPESVERRRRRRRRRSFVMIMMKQAKRWGADKNGRWQTDFIRCE